MTKYRITRYAGEANPCAIADPAGCFYSTGEVDRKLVELEELLARRDKKIGEVMDLGSVVIEAMTEEYGEARILITDMLAWFKWFQPYPSIAIQEFIARGSRFEGRGTDDERAAETVPEGNPRAEG